jgi:hypothetical protein
MRRLPAIALILALAWGSVNVRAESGTRFVKIYSGVFFAILEDGQGRLYGIGEMREDSGLRWTYGAFAPLGGSLADNNWPGREKAPDSPYYITDKNAFVERETGRVIAEGVKDVYSYNSHRRYASERALILKNDGSLWVCRLNDGAARWLDGKDLSAPLKVMDGVKSAAAGGGLGYFAVKENGELWHFGGNFGGEKGIGVQEYYNYQLYDEERALKNLKPSKVMDGVTKVLYNGGYTLALKENGDLYGWGNNDYGQLNYAVFEDIFEPRKMNTDVADIGQAHSCSFIVRKDGSAWMCGVVPGAEGAKPDPVWQRAAVDGGGNG